MRYGGYDRAPAIGSGHDLRERLGNGQSAPAIGAGHDLRERLGSNGQSAPGQTNGNGQSAPGQANSSSSFNFGVTNGTIWMCNLQTADECLQRNLFGTKQGRVGTEVARAVQQDATRCFLYNTSTKSFIGPFRAAGKVEKLIEPYAWARSGGPSPFPLQLRVYAEAEALFELKESELSPFLTFTGRHFNLTVNQEQAEKIGERLLKYGKSVRRRA